MLPGIFLILQDPDQYLYHVQQASLLLCCSLLCMTFVAIIDDSSPLAITLAIASAGFSGVGADGMSLISLFMVIFLAFI